MQNPITTRTQSRFTHNSKGEQMLRIGRGEQADVYRMLAGDFRGLACRLPQDRPCVVNSQKEALLRFRRHQIASSFFPESNLNVVAVDLQTRGMFSEEIERSKQNLRDCTSHGLSRRAERVAKPLPKMAASVLEKMFEAGVLAEANLPNVAIVGGTAICFEIQGIDIHKARTWLTSNNLSPARINHCLRLLELYEFEILVPEVDLYLLLTDLDERTKILRDYKKLHLQDYYSSAIGGEVLI
jgi:hypothetical protein